MPDSLSPSWFSATLSSLAVERPPKPPWGLSAGLSVESRGCTPIPSWVTVGDQVPGPDVRASLPGSRSPVEDREEGHEWWLRPAWVDLRGGFGSRCSIRWNLRRAVGAGVTRRWSLVEVDEISMRSDRGAGGSGHPKADEKGVDVATWLEALGILIRLKLDGEDADAYPDGRLAAAGLVALTCPSRWSSMTIAWSVGSPVGSTTDGLSVSTWYQRIAQISPSSGWGTLTTSRRVFLLLQHQSLRQDLLIRFTYLLLPTLLERLLVRELFLQLDLCFDVLQSHGGLLHTPVSGEHRVAECALALGPLASLWCTIGLGLWRRGECGRRQGPPSRSLARWVVDGGSSSLFSLSFSFTLILIFHVPPSIVLPPPIFFSPSPTRPTGSASTLPPRMIRDRTRIRALALTLGLVPPPPSSSRPLPIPPPLRLVPPPGPDRTAIRKRIIALAPASAPTLTRTIIPHPVPLPLRQLLDPPHLLILHFLRPLRVLLGLLAVAPPRPPSDDERDRTPDGDAEELPPREMGARDRFGEDGGGGGFGRGYGSIGGLGGLPRGEIRDAHRPALRILSGGSGPRLRKVVGAGLGSLGISDRRLGMTVRMRRARENVVKGGRVFERRKE